MSYEEFRKETLKVNNKRNFKVTGSLGVYDAYKWIRKNKWLNLDRPVTEHEFYSVIRKVNKYFIDSMLEGHNIKFPHKMGQLELRKYNATFKLVDNKVVTNLPIDWDSTLKYWYEDKKAYDNKTLLKLNEKEIFKICYNKTKANYENKSFYTFKPNRVFKLLIKNNIKNNNLDAFKL